MNKFVTGALAMAAAGTVATASSGDSEWLELDSEITSLASSLAPQGDGGGWSALLRSTYTFSNDNLATGGANNPDISGFTLDDVDIAAFGEVGDYGYRVNFDLDDGTASLEDAFVFWNCGDYLTATMGQYKPRVFHSNYVDPENQLFINRTLLGSAFDGWDTGVGGSGTYDDFAWNVDVQNGSGGAGGGQVSDHRYIFRGMYNWNGGIGDYEGAYGAGDDPAGTFGVTYVLDDTVVDTNADGGKDGAMFGFDATGTAGPIGWGVEWADFDDDFTGSTGTNYSRLATGIPLFGDSNPYSGTVSYRINDEFEAAVRFQDADNSATTGPDNSLISLGLNWYQSGHRAKWQAEITDIESDAATGDDDTTIFQIGVSVGSTR